MLIFIAVLSGIVVAAVERMREARLRRKESG
jgi:hypothetical protein